MPRLNMGLSLTPSGVLSGTPTIDGEFHITLKVTDAQNRSASVLTTVRVSLARSPAGFALKGNLNIPRAGHSATLLLSGNVLVAGGGNGVPDPTAELYDPATGTFTRTTGNMTKARSRHTATLLKLSNPADRNYGKVLILGSGDTTAELYDPATSTFRATTGSMKHARTSPTATLLSTGKVLIVGGSTTPNDPTAELYDPASETFSFTGDTTLARSGHTATLLHNGTVLIAGGAAAATAELYNPGSGKFTPTVGDMTEPRSGHTATLLGAADGVQSGYVLIVGVDGTAELYDPNTETFARTGSLLPSMHPSYRHTASSRNDGTVLVAGGYKFIQIGSCQVPSAQNAAALFAPESDGFTAPTGTLTVARDTHTATVLEDGTVLVVGGIQQTFTQSGTQCVVTNGILDQAELFQTARPGSPPLSGTCFGRLQFVPMCGVTQDFTQCPVGTPAIAPTAVSCGFFGSGFVDIARQCTVRTSTGQRRSGYCSIH
jgi:WD40 repeat protein